MARLIARYYVIAWPGIQTRSTRRLHRRVVNLQSRIAYLEQWHEKRIAFQDDASQVANTLCHSKITPPITYISLKTILLATRNVLKRASSATHCTSFNSVTFNDVTYVTDDSDR